MVPAPSLPGLAFQSEVAESEPRSSNVSWEACVPTSWRPVLVKTEIWSLLFLVTVMFISCESWVTAWSR